MSKNAELKNNLLEILAGCTDALDEASGAIIASMESAKDMSALDALYTRVDAEDAVQTARGVAYHALSDLNEADAAEVIMLAAEICSTALDVQEFLDNSLDDAMEASDALLEMAMEALDKAEEGEEDEEEDGDAVFDALMELLEDMGLIGEGDTVTVRISPASDEEDDGEEDDVEDEGNNNDLADAFAEVFDDLANYFSSLGLMGEDDILTITIESDKKD